MDIASPIQTNLKPPAVQDHGRLPEDTVDVGGLVDPLFSDVKKSASPARSRSVTMRVFSPRSSAL